jgi:hypothetical protein
MQRRRFSLRAARALVATLPLVALVIMGGQSAARSGTPYVAAASTYNDGARSIFGLSGAFGDCAGVKCGFAGPISMRQAALLGSSYVRISAILNCPFAPSTPFRTVGSDAPLATLLAQAATVGLIPILNVVTPDACGVNVPLTPEQWRAQLFTFVIDMHEHNWYPRDKWIYFEIGNEVNLDPAPYCIDLSLTGCRNGGWERGYAQVFGNAAAGIAAAMTAQGSDKFRVVTAGMVHPTASSDCTDSFDPGHPNIDAAATAIHTAEGAPFNVPSRHLGVGIHPYRYNTDERSFWLNYYHEGNGYAGSCYDLQKMITLWSSTFDGLPLIVSESNWSDSPTTNPRCVALTSCEGTYLVDLFTWLYDHPVKGRGSYADPATSQLRVAFFRGIDSANNPLGLYGLSSGGGTIHDKPFWIGSCSQNSVVSGWKSMATAFESLASWTLNSSACY